MLGTRYVTITSVGLQQGDGATYPAVYRKPCISRVQGRRARGSCMVDMVDSRSSCSGTPRVWHGEAITVWCGAISHD
jgi:hypothetical protein